jgi:hypothetical protein
MPGAGGLLGAYSATNIFRLFITPTITGAIGFAFCFGGPSMIVGNIIAPGISPLVPG